jgi:hypothetical protein
MMEIQEEPGTSKSAKLASNNEVQYGQPIRKVAKFYFDKKVLSQWESDLRKMTKIYRSVPTDSDRIWQYGEWFDNPDHKKNLRVWEEARKIFNRYEKNIHNIVYDDMLPGPDKEKTWQERAIREKAWSFITDIRSSSLFDRSYNYRTDQHEPDLPKLGQIREANIRRYQNSAREFFEALEDWLALKGGSHSSNRIEQMNLAGFQVRIYDAKGLEGKIAFAKAGLEKYKERAQAYAPILLQHQVPINIYPNKSHGDAEASYDPTTKTISLWEWATISSRRINRLVWVLAHEMGHHVFKTVLNNSQRNLWERVIKGDYKDLDFRDVVKMMRPGEDISDFIKRIENEDPILQLQLETLWYNPSTKDLELFSIRDIIKYLEKGGNPMVRVPTTPISQYAAKNPEEAFCEAIGVLVGLGPQGLHEKVRALLRIMIPSIRIAKLTSDDVVTRLKDATKNLSRTGRTIRKASKISAMIPASTIFSGGWEWDLPGFADWPKFMRMPKEKQIAWAESFMAAGPKEPVDIAVYASGGVDFEDGHHRVMAGKILGLKIPVRVRFINFNPDWWPALLELLEAGYSPRQYNPQSWKLSRVGVPPLEVVRKGRDAADNWIIDEMERDQQEKDEQEDRERAGRKSASNGMVKSSSTKRFAGILEAPPAMVESIYEWTMNVLTHRLIDLLAKRFQGVREWLGIESKFEALLKKAERVFKANADHRQQKLDVFVEIISHEAFLLMYSIKTHKQITQSNFERMSEGKKLVHWVNALKADLAEKRKSVAQFATGNLKLESNLRITMPNVKATDTVKWFPVDLTGWKYEAKFAPIIKEFGFDKIKVVLATKDSREGASWHASSGTLTLNVLHTSTGAVSLLDKEFQDNLKMFIRHELQHMAQYLISLAGFPQGGLPSRKIQEPHIDWLFGGSLPKNMDHYYGDDVEYMTQLADAVDYFERKKKGGHITDVKSAIRYFTGSGLGSGLGSDNDRLINEKIKPSPFFASLKKTSPGKYRSAIKEFTKAVL